MSMAIKGSHTKLQHETTVTLHLGKFSRPCTLHIASLNKWDLILGMPFLHEMHAILDIRTKSVFLKKLKTLLMSYQHKSTKLTLFAFQLIPTEQLFDPVKEFPKVFLPDHPHILPPLQDGFNHQINFKDDSLIIRPKPFGVPLKWQTNLNEKIKKDEQSGRIYLTSLGQAATIFCVSRANEPDKPHFVVDLRERNNNTIPDIFLPPDQHTVLQILAAAKV
jgi:hypothetical protein